MKKNKILIIKGPIISTGRNIFIDNFKDNIVEFNCIDYIEYYIKEYRNIFSKIVICTWSNQKSFLQKIDPLLLKDIDFIKYLDDDINDKRERKLHFSNNYEYKFLNNTNRALRLLGFSLRNLDINKDDYIYVVRPDMKIDLNETFKNQFLKKLDNNKIVIPCFTKSHAVHDLFFIFTYENALKFFNAQNKKIYPTYNPHTDYPINYLFSKLKKGHLRNLLYKLRKSVFGRALFLELISFSFIPTSRNFLIGIHWRGRKVESHEIPSYFNFNKNNLVSFLYNTLKLLIKIFLSKFIVISH